MPRLPSIASLPSFSSSSSLQDMAGSTQHSQFAGCGQLLQDPAACTRAAQQQDMQAMSQPAWHAAAHLPQQQQQQQRQQQHDKQLGVVQWMLGLLWYIVFVPLLPLTWLCRAAAKVFTLRSTLKQQRQQQDGLQYACAQAHQPQEAATAAAAPATARAHRRSIVFEQPSGFGVHERSKRRGLLEVSNTLAPCSLMPFELMAASPTPAVGAS
jgi:hypothetical protein